MLALIVPLFDRVGTVDPSLMSTAIAVSSTVVAMTEPDTPMPFAIVTEPPWPPITTA